MPTYTSLVNVDRDFQNVQELASIWGELRTDIEQLQLNVELIDTYAVLGDYDFIVIFEAADRDAAFQLALALQGRGFDMQTMEVVSTDHFATLVEDVS